MQSSPPDLKTLVRAEVRQIMAVAANVAPDAKIAMPLAQFQALGEMLAALCNQIDQLEADREGTFQDARYWVPLQRYEQLRVTLDSTQRLRAS